MLCSDKPSFALHGDTTTIVVAHIFSFDPQAVKQDKVRLELLSLCTIKAQQEMVHYPGS